MNLYFCSMGAPTAPPRGPVVTSAGLTGGVGVVTSAGLTGGVGVGAGGAGASGVVAVSPPVRPPFLATSVRPVLDPISEYDELVAVTRELQLKLITPLQKKCLENDLKRTIISWMDASRGAGQIVGKSSIDAYRSAVTAGGRVLPLEFVRNCNYADERDFLPGGVFSPVFQKIQTKDGVIQENVSLAEVFSNLGHYFPRIPLGTDLLADREEASGPILVQSHSNLTFVPLSEVAGSVNVQEMGRVLHPVGVDSTKETAVLLLFVDAEGTRKGWCIARPGESYVLRPRESDETKTRSVAFKREEDNRVLSAFVEGASLGASREAIELEKELSANSFTVVSVPLERKKVLEDKITIGGQVFSRSSFQLKNKPGHGLLIISGGRDHGNISKGLGVAKGFGLGTPKGLGVVIGSREAVLAPSLAASATALARSTDGSFVYSCSDGEIWKPAEWVGQYAWHMGPKVRVETSLFSVVTRAALEDPEQLAALFVRQLKNREGVDNILRLSNDVVASPNISTLLCSNLLPLIPGQSFNATITNVASLTRAVSVGLASVGGESVAGAGAGFAVAGAEEDTNLLPPMSNLSVSLASESVSGEGAGSVALEYEGVYIEKSFFEFLQELSDGGFLYCIQKTNLGEYVFRKFTKMDQKYIISDKFLAICPDSKDCLDEVVPLVRADGGEAHVLLNIDGTDIKFTVIRTNDYKILLLNGFIL